MKKTELQMILDLTGGLPIHGTNNKSAVLSFMNSTKRKLRKNPLWEEVYENQLKDLISRGFVREVTEDELVDWIKEGGKTYYIAQPRK